MNPNELIQRYLLGIANENEVADLEQQLKKDPKLVEQYLLEAELDAFLRQEAHSIDPQSLPAETSPAEMLVPPQRPRQFGSVHVWQCLSVVSTIATVLLALWVFRLPAERQAIAFPVSSWPQSKVALAENNIWDVCRHGNLDHLRVLLSQGVSADAQVENNYTPLHFAAAFNQPRCVDLLLDHDVAIAKADQKGNTALHMAAFFGNTEVVKILLERGSNPSTRNLDGFTARDMVAISWSADLESIYASLESQMHTSFDFDRIRKQRKKIEKLFSELNEHAAPQVPSVDIWKAAVTGNSNAIQQHIDAGTPLNQQETFGGCTPLMLATIFGHEDIARTLINDGADLEIRNKSGDTAIFLACFFARPNIVKRLLKADADTNLSNAYDQTPLASVSQNLDDQLRAVYEHVFQSLNLPLDLETIIQNRKEIETILRNHQLSASE